MSKRISLASGLGIVFAALSIFCGPIQPPTAYAVDQLAASFETGLEGWARNPVSFGTTVTQDTIGATHGTNSMKVSIVGGAVTFEGVIGGSLDPSIFGDPPGLDHVHFDVTVTQRFDHPNENPPGFARIGVIVFGVTQPDFQPAPNTGVQSQIANVVEDEVSIGNLEPGTYRDMRIDLDKMGNPLDFSIQSFNQIFGTLGSNPNDIIPTGFEFYFNKSPGDTFPLTVYIDNVRFGMSIPGDYNGNDVVDAGDYVLWRKMPGTVPPNANFRNEVVTPGNVQPGDYDAWRARFGNNSLPGSGLTNGAIPEPASSLLLTLALCLAYAASHRIRYVQFRGNSVSKVCLMTRVTPNQS